jgi:pentapeptide MXKDX repeat protein
VFVALLVAASGAVAAHLHYEYVRARHIETLRAALDDPWKRVVPEPGRGVTAVRTHALPIGVVCFAAAVGLAVGDLFLAKAWMDGPDGRQGACARVSAETRKAIRADPMRVDSMRVDFMRVDSMRVDFMRVDSMHIGSR